MRSYLRGRANPNVRRLERQDREHRRNVERLANGFPGEPDYNTKPNFGLKPRIHGENQRTVAPRKPRK